jgi:DNA polymerase III sliding clamp (beta) subunit (PCNA family)
MERKQLLDKLEVVAPALSAHRLLPIMTHVWFTGDQVMAYNDAISISTPLKTDFVGAVPGETLISILKSSVAKDLEFTPDDKVLNIKAGKSKLKFGMLPESQFCFKMPEPAGKDRQLRVDMLKFIDALELCLLSVGNDATVPDQLGVTLQAKGKDLDMYSTNNSTIMNAWVKMNGEAPFKSVILPTQFCEQLIRLCRGHKTPTLELYDDHALLVAGPNMLFGRLIESTHPVKFRQMLDHHFPDNDETKLIKIPDVTGNILERAIVIVDSAVERNFTTISVVDGTMKFLSKSERGEIIDTMIAKGHPDTEVNIEPKWLKAVLDKFENMLVTNDCAVLEKQGALYLIASRSA